MALSRRGLLGGLLVALAAPAIVRPGLLMPVKPVLVVSTERWRMGPSLLEEYAGLCAEWSNGWLLKDGQDFVPGDRAGEAMAKLARMHELEATIAGRLPPQNNWAEHWAAVRRDGLA
jgi:hypothetical protein